MPYLLLGLLAFIIFLFAAKKFVQADASQMARDIRRMLGFMLLGLALLFAVTGRFPIALPLAFIGYMFLRGGLGALFGAGKRPRAGTRQGNTGTAPRSQVRTDWLEMMLNHDDGTMMGRILRGEHLGKELSALSLSEIIEFWKMVSRSDPQSGQLIEAYLDHMHADWRARAGGAEDDSGAAHEGDGQQANNNEGLGSGHMSREDAYNILGLDIGASRGEIQQAHRRLMKKFHPDQGGSTYLAARINQAKDMLLGE